MLRFKNNANCRPVGIHYAVSVRLVSFFSIIIFKAAIYFLPQASNLDRGHVTRMVLSDIWFNPHVHNATLFIKCPIVLRLVRL